MARHAAPRSPWFRRSIFGGAALAATAGLGVLVAPHTDVSTLHLPEALVGAEPTSPEIDLTAIQARLETQNRQADERDAAAVQQAAAESDAVQAIEQAAQSAAAATETSSPVEEVPSPSPTPEAATETAPTEVEEQAPPSVDEPTPSTTPSAPSGTYQDYALQLLGGDADEMAALEKLWGRESGWNPTAQNPTSTAYGIPQFLNSTWAGTGIAKTSDPYLQIEAGLIYIEARYGSPTAAWAHSQATGWY